MRKTLLNHVLRGAQPSVVQEGLPGPLSRLLGGGGDAPDEAGVTVCHERHDALEQYCQCFVQKRKGPASFHVPTWPGTSLSKTIFSLSHLLLRTSLKLDYVFVKFSLIVKGVQSRYRSC